jgi:hypothetical protein
VGASGERPADLCAAFDPGRFVVRAGGAAGFRSAA